MTEHGKHLSVDVMIALRGQSYTWHSEWHILITLWSYDAPRHMSSYRKLNLRSSLCWESVETKQVMTLSKLIIAECHVMSTSQAAARASDTEICLLWSRQWRRSTLDEI